MPSRRWALGAAGALVAAGVVALLWFGQLDRPGIWTDEDYSLRFAESYATVDDDLHPPTYYALLRTWFLATPDTLTSARVLSTVAFLGAVGGWAVLGRRWWREGRLPAVAVLTAVALSLLSPQALLFGRMARYFGLVALGTSLALLSWWATLERGGRGRTAVAVAAHVAVGLLSYPAFAVLVAAETATVVLRRRDALARHLPMAIVAGALFLVAVVALPTDDRQFGGTEDVNRPAMAAVAVTLPLWSATVGETVVPFDPVAAVPAALAWAVVAAGVVAALRDRSAARASPPGPDEDRQARTVGWLPADPAVFLCVALVLGTLASLVVVTFTVDLAHTGLQAPKYFAPVVPAFYLLAGLGIDRVVRWGRGRVVLGAAVAAITVGWAIGLTNLYDGRDYLYPSYALPWAEVADRIDEIAGHEGDDGRLVVVVASDRSMLRLLAERRPRADLVDANEIGDDSIVYDGVPGTDHDVLILVQRQRLSAPAEQSVERIGQVAERQGFEPVSEETFGTVDPGLRRLQELFSGRDLDPHLVELRLLARDDG